MPQGVRPDRLGDSGAAGQAAHHRGGAVTVQPLAVGADNAAFAAHSASEVHAAAAPVFTELIAEADVMNGETLMAKGLGD